MTIAPDQPSPAFAGQPPHVLIVDDETMLVEELVEYLHAQGMRADGDSSGKAALARLAADPSITVMLSDIRMPEMDGLALASQAIAQRGEADALEIVMLTGNATLADTTAAMRMRAIDFLEKPIQLGKLKGSLLRAHQAATERRDRHREMATLQQLQQDLLRDVAGLQSAVAGLQARLAREEPGADGGRDAFLSVVNHELRTPLVPIIGLAGLIEDEPGTISPEDLRLFARQIRLGGLRLERAISRIAEYTEVASGKARIQVAECRPDELLRSAEINARPSLAERNQTLLVSAQTRRICETDAVRLLRLLDEVLDNASRFSPRGTTIRLSVREQEDRLIFAIADEGPGMTQQEIVRAIEPFRTLDMSLTRPVDGLGVGLSLATRIAMRLGGHLSITSEPGQGSVVIIDLPVRSSDGASA